MFKGQPPYVLLININFVLLLRISILGIMNCSTFTLFVKWWWWKLLVQIYIASLKKVFSENTALDLDHWHETGLLSNLLINCMQ